MSVLGQDPEVVGSPRWNPVFDHLPGSYLDNLDVGGLLEDHLQVIKREMLGEEGVTALLMAIVCWLAL